MSGEICRKILHMSPGLLPFALYLVPHPDPLDTTSLVIVTIICFVMTLTYLALHRVVRRPDEDNFLTTTLSYPLIVWATLILFPAHAELTMVVVIILALGDGSAYIFGRALGKTKLPWNGDKSWAGMFGFVAVSAPLAILAYYLEANNPPAPLAMAILCAGAASVVAAIAESLPTEISDNLRVGLAASVTVVATHFASTGFFLT